MSEQEEYEAVYHSNYDSYYWTTHFGDTNFSYHGGIAQFYGYTLLRLACDNVLPFDLTEYATDIYGRLKEIIAKYESLSLDWSSLEESILLMNTSAISINKEISDYKEWESGIKRQEDLFVNSLKLRSINDRLMNVDKSFLTDQFLMTDSQFYRHILYSLSDDDSYSSDLMPALLNQLSAGNTSQAQFLIKRYATVFKGVAYSLSDQFIWQ